MNKEQALHKFWSSFDLKAYDENTVPDGLTQPYITYEAIDGFFGDTISLTASIWYQSKSWEDITLKKNQIANSIGLGGKIIPYDNGSFWIKRGTPFARRVADENDNIRRIIVNIEVEYFS